MSKSINDSIGSVYLIKLHASTRKYFCTTEGVSDVIKNCEYGIESVKIFDNIKDKFQRVSKSDLKSFWGWNTEVMQNKFIKSFLNIK